MQVSIIIPTKDRGEVFDETLRNAVEAIGSLDAEIIVVNDSKSAKPVIPDNDLKVRCVNNPKNGVASARNLGASLALADFFIFMDDDFLISRESIVHAIENAAKHPKKIHLFNWVYPPNLERSLTEFQFGRYLTTFGFTTLKGWLGDGWRNEEIFELKDGASYFLPIAKSVFNEIGGYNENFLHAGAEDYDFVQHAKKKGVKFYLDKSCVIYHNEKDRIDLKVWLERKKRNGETIRMAVNLGHAELSLRYSRSKKLVFLGLSKIKPLLFVLQRTIPNVPFLDRIYFRLTNMLLSIYLFEGYTKKT